MASREESHVPLIGMPPSPIRVVFLTFYFEAWDALAGIHAEMLKSDLFDVKVISIPRRFRKDEPFHDEDLVSGFLDSAGVAHERFDFEDSFDGLAKLREFQPDYVFINYPWQRNYQPGYRVGNLAEFTKVCYVPYYSLGLVKEPLWDGIAPHIYTQRSHQLSSLVFTPDAETRDAYASTSRGNEHVHFTGSPKLDALIRRVLEEEPYWPLNNPGNRRLIWAPHHSFTSSWLNFGVFPKVFEEMLDFAKSNPELDIVLRPHPIMFGSLVSGGFIAEARLESWKQEWTSLPNATIDGDGDIAKLFSASDLLITDGISFLGEYPLATGKPAIYFENKDHWKWSKLGELAYASNIRVSNFEEFQIAFEGISANGLPDYSASIEKLRRAARPFPGLVASKIVEVVLNDFERQTPLVDKPLVTEVPWEQLPGAEAPWD